MKIVHYTFIKCVKIQFYLDSYAGLWPWNRRDPRVFIDISSYLMYFVSS